MSVKCFNGFRVYCVILTLVLAAGCSYQDCVLPPHPANGKHIPFEDDCPVGTQSAACQGVPGARVPDGWFLFTTCDEGFVLDIAAEEHGHSQSTCADTKWLPPLPSCVYNITNDKDKCTAPPYPKNGKYKPLPIECALSSQASETLIRPGSFLPSACVLLYSCYENYELSDNDVISVCDKGKWIPKVTACNSSSSVLIKTDSDQKPPTPSAEGCMLPPAQNRRFCSFECSECYRCSYTPGTLVTDRVIQVQCRPGYRLANNQDFSAVACVNGSWNSEFTKCMKLCPPLESDSVFPSCQFGTTQVDCSKPMIPATTATYQCRPSHTEYPSLTQAGVYKRTLTCRHNGKWSNSLPECEPACGVSKGGIKISPTVVDGSDTPLGAFPWHAGLYRWEDPNWNCICGGSLISNRVVLTAAHCVTLMQPDELRVGLGKYYRSWKYEERYAVKANVSAVKVPREYNGGVTTYAWDIALLLLSERVQINSFVMPVCRDDTVTLKVIQDTLGYVVGWGKTMENGKESEILLHSDFSILEYNACFRKLPKILAFDKFCGVKGSASVAEKGDSGGGVTIVSNDLHFIVGIVSVKISNISVFTNVSWSTHKNWIENEITNFDKEIIR